ncbi:unnamed protein product, partial [Effrenium voratum]
CCFYKQRDEDDRCDMAVALDRADVRPTRDKDRARRDSFGVASEAKESSPGLKLPMLSEPSAESKAKSSSPKNVADLVTQDTRRSAQNGQAPNEAASSSRAPQAIIASPSVGSRATLLPPKEARFHGSKTLVLDLDETLVHSSFTPVACDLVLTVALGTEEHKVYVRKRPGLEEFMNTVSKLFEVAVFTASTALYANSLLDVLDTKGWIQHRLFREACTRYKEGYVKDLSRLGRDLNHVIIIDNMPICYALQPHNAIPIRTWKHDPKDTELLDLMPILMTLARVDQIPRMLRAILSDEAEVGG